MLYYSYSRLDYGIRNFGIIILEPWSKRIAKRVKRRTMSQTNASLPTVDCHCQLSTANYQRPRERSTQSKMSTWHQEEKHSNVLLEFSSSSWLSLSFLFWFSILKSARLGLRFVLVCLVWFSPDSDGSESGWWTISIWQLVSRVHCPNLVLFYFILVFLHPKSSIGRKPRVRFFECVFFIIYQRPQTWVGLNWKSEETYSTTKQQKST